MDYNQIKKIIDEDYGKVEQAKLPTGRPMKEFYSIFAKALEELHTAIGPFVTNKQQFIEYIRNLKDSTNKDVYAAIIDYCSNKLKLSI